VRIAPGGGLVADGFAELRAQIARLRALPELAARAAPEVAEAVRREILEGAARGVGPDGVPWQATQAGGRPLQGVARNLSVEARGSVVVVRLEGHHARHHLGAVKGSVRRAVIPDKKIPGPVARAVGAVVERHFARTMGGPA